MAKGNYAAALGSGSYVESIEGNKELEDQQLRNGGEQHYAAAKRSRGVITVHMIPGWKDKARQSDNTNKGIWKFAHGKGTKSNQIKDGTSKTIIVSEVLSVDDNEGNGNRFSLDIRGVWASPSMGASTYTHGHPESSSNRLTRITLLPNSLGTETPALQDNINACPQRSIPPDSPMICVRVAAQGRRAGDTWASARSAHPGGVIAGRADGSVGFYPDGTDDNAWYALGTRQAADRVEDE
jgi:hypothetical protein